MSLWQYRCPKGHASIPDSAGDQTTYSCGACGESYDHGPYDVAEWSFPVLPPNIRTRNGNRAKLLEQTHDPPRFTPKQIHEVYVAEYKNIDYGTFHSLEDCRYINQSRVNCVGVGTAVGNGRSECELCKRKRAKPLAKDTQFQMDRLEAERATAD